MQTRHPHLVNIVLVALALLMASLACNLTGADETSSSPTQPVLIGNNNPAALTATAIKQSQQFPTPTPTFAPTSTTSGGGVVQPSCTPRTDWPTYQVVSGDTVSSLALRTDTTIEALVAANCLANANQLSVGQVLRVPKTPRALPTNTPSLTCSTQWFFTFEAGAGDPACPGPLYSGSAIGQDFEGGRVYRYPAIAPDVDPRGTVWVIYNEGDWETYPDTWDGTPLPTDPSIVPPTGRYQPQDAIGLVWRSFPEVRNRLGWAYEPQALFTGRFQEPIDPTRNPAQWYIDHGKWGVVLRVTSVNMGPNTWEVIGGY